MIAAHWVRELPKSNYSTVDLRTNRKVASADIGLESRRAHPGRGWCLRCGLSNAEVEMYPLRIDDHSGVTIACTTCWDECDLVERSKLARVLARSWIVGHLDAAFSKHVTLPDDDDSLAEVLEAIERDAQDEP